MPVIVIPRCNNPPQNAGNDAEYATTQGLCKIRASAPFAIFQGWLVSLPLLAAYACGTYGAGSYGTCSGVGVPNTGFGPLDMLKATLTSPYFIAGLALAVIGLVVIAFVARRQRR